MKQLKEKCKECYCSKCSQNDTIHDRKTKYGCKCRKKCTPVRKGQCPYTEYITL